MNNNADRTVRLAEVQDIEQIMQMCDHSRHLMRAQGNDGQWQGGYPSRQVIAQDIAQGHGHLVCEDGTPTAYFAFIVGPDPTYQTIYEGQWLDDETPYGTIHRLASNGRAGGVGRTCFQWAASQPQVGSLRSDTHALNAAMHHILEAEGFTRCGIIHVADGLRDAYQKMTYPTVRPALRQYVEEEILPQYRAFDAAHRPDHILTVMAQSMLLSRHYPELDPDMVYTIAAYHDLGIAEGRETHHLASARLLRGDRRLGEWFSPQQTALMAEAVEDHRASSSHDPRSLYGRIVAEADRDIDPLKVVRRTVQYGLAHHPGLDREGHYRRTLQHLHEKYGPGGYLKLYIPHSRNQQRLEELRSLIADEARLRTLFDNIYNQLQP